MSAPARTLIVIVNYRTGPLVVACLHSLAAELAGRTDVRVDVVDNCSGDGSAHHIQAAIELNGWNAWARVLPAPVNGGFAYGNNLAIQAALRDETPPDFFWVLNPDTVVRPGALDALVNFLQTHPQVGIAGSSLEEANGQLWPYAFRFPSVWSELDQGLRLGIVTRLLRHRVVARRMSDQAEAVDWLPGASMMVRRQVFETAGLMDPGYFLYFEETDFCLAARRAGWACWYVPQSRVMHIAGQSTGVTSKSDRPRRLPAYWFESRRRYFVKNHGRVYAMLTDLVWLCGHVLHRARSRLMRRSADQPPRVMRDFVAHSAWTNRSLPSPKAMGAALQTTPGQTQ